MYASLRYIVDEASHFLSVPSLSSWSVSLRVPVPFSAKDVFGHLIEAKYHCFLLVSLVSTFNCRMLSALPFPASTSAFASSTTSVPVAPPNTEGEDSDDNESDSGDDDDHDHHGDQQHSLGADVSTVNSLSSLQTPTISATISSSLPVISGSTTLVTSRTSSSFQSTSSSTASSTKAAQVFDSGSIDSIPQNEADPAIESRMTASPLGTAGIILVAIFGFIALVTTFYLFFRLKRRRQAQSNGMGSMQRPNTGASLEKALPSCWASQETGIIFGRRSPAQSHGTGRFSFLNRRWYSTGSEATPPQAQHSPLSPATSPRWDPSLFGLGLRSRAATPRFHSVSTAALEAPYRSKTPDTVDCLSSAAHRNHSHSSSSGSGSGHARAYAHHDIKTPRQSVTSSITSRWLRRRDREQMSPTFRTSVSESSDMYARLKRRKTSSQRSTTLNGDSTWTMPSDCSVPPRIPLPVAVSDGRKSTRQSL